MDAPRLSRAWACLDCELIFADLENGRCPCSSESVFHLSKILNPDPVLINPPQPESALDSATN